MGACDSQPLARESMDQAMSMPHRVRIYSETSPMHGPPCQHPPCKASSRAVTRGDPPPPPVTAAVRVHNTQHCTPVSPVYMARGYGSGGPQMPHEPEEATIIQLVVYVVVLAWYSGLYPYPYPYLPPPPSLQGAKIFKGVGVKDYTLCLGARNAPCIYAQNA